MTDDQSTTESQQPERDRAPQADNAVTHGAYRYLKTGELPDSLQGLDKEIAGEILKQTGGDDKFRLMATSAARAFLVTELIWRHIVKTYDPTSGALPGGLRIFSGYQESLRRNLEAMGLTPASAGRVKLDSDPVNAAKVLADIKESRK